MSEPRCHICGAEMSHVNPEICKNFHVQQARRKQEQPKEYTAMGEINYCEYLRLKCTGNHDTCPKVTHRCITEELCMHLPDTRSRPHPAPAPDLPTYIPTQGNFVKEYTKQKQKEQDEHDAAIARKAREDVLKECILAIRNTPGTLICADGSLKPKHCWTPNQIIRVVESL